MYQYASSNPPPAKKPTWLEVQDLAFSTEKGSFEKLTSLILEAERTSVRLPVVRVATEDLKDLAKKLDIKKGDTVICDIVSILFLPLTLRYLHSL